MALTLHKAEGTHWWPLHEGGDCGQQLIAGRAFVEFQNENSKGVKNAHQYENAWVTKADWKALTKVSKPAVLRSSAGDLLAWVGTPSGVEVRATEESSLLNYAWDFIGLNEKIVSDLEGDSIRGELSPAAHVDGWLHLGKGSRILPGVVIEGNVVIGEDCKIGPNCYLRGATTIGDGCFIGQSVEIKNSIIGHGSCVAHLSYVGDTVLGNRVNLGAGTITSNFRHDGLNHRSMIEGSLLDTGREKLGAIVGDGVRTGILTAIYPGRKLGPNVTTLPNETVKIDIPG